MPPMAPDTALLELIVHELRTPLAVASGSWPQVGRGVALTPEQQAAAERVDRSLHRVEALVEQLRRLSRIPAGVPPGRVALGPLIDHARVQPEAERRGIDFAPPDLSDDVAVRAVRETLEEAVAGIVGAVARSAPNRSTVPIDTRVEAREVRVLVGDLDAASESEFPAEFVGGLGFSMPIARAAIESAGGRIWSKGVDGRIAGIGFVLPRG